MLIYSAGKDCLAIEQTEAYATGRLFYFMGPSGVGKDTILNTLRVLQTDNIFFATRYITRPVIDSGETHIEITEKAFLQRRRKGFFALTWQSHGFYYGIPAQILSIMDEGKDVIINGSRSYFVEAVKIIPNIIPVLVTASEEIVLQRLTARGRESEKEIQKRIQRLKDFSIEHPDLITLENEFTPEATAIFFLNRIRTNCIIDKAS